MVIQVARCVHRTVRNIKKILLFLTDCIPLEMAKVDSIDKRGGGYKYLLGNKLPSADIFPFVMSTTFPLARISDCARVETVLYTFMPY